MANLEAMHSFLEEVPINRDQNIFVRFMRKKFKCFIIFFLTLCVLGETMLMAFDKFNFDNLNQLFKKMIEHNQTNILH